MTAAAVREAEILMRLETVGRMGRTVSGFYHPDDHAILRRMAAAGRIDVQPGQGRDQGLLLARLKPPPTLRAAGPAMGPEGGAA